MCATAHAAQAFLEGACPAFANRQSDNRLIIGRDLRAERRERGIVGYGFDGDHGQAIIDSQADPHFMHRLLGGHCPALVRRKTIGFIVGDMAFNIPQSVGAAIAFAGDNTGMDRRARRSR